MGGISIHFALSKLRISPFPSRLSEIMSLPKKSLAFEESRKKEKGIEKRVKKEEGMKSG